MADAPIDELFARTLTGDYDDDVPWEAVHALRKLGTRDVFDKASQWCASDNPLMRARGIDVLAQLGKTVEHHTNRFPEEAYAITSRLLLNEEDETPLISALTALGHLDNLAAVPLIAKFHSHPSPDIRFAVAFSLGQYANDDLSVESLLRLTEDTDTRVRDWATFGLGVLGNQDSSAIRDALFRSLIDSDEDVREEAMVGLGKRKDRRVLPYLFAALKGPEVKVRVAEAASYLLGMHRDPENWGTNEYRTALESHFPERDNH
jgi:HEAT repeat protein